MSILQTSDVEGELLKLLGLEDQEVRAVTIRFEVDNVVIIDVELYGQETRLGRLCGLFGCDATPIEQRRYLFKSSRGTGQWPNRPRSGMQPPNPPPRK